MKAAMIALAALVAAAASGALAYTQLRAREAAALNAFLEQAQAMTAGSDCLKADAALPLLERIASQVEASRFMDSGALVQAGQRLLVPAIQCQMWIRAQNLTFDELEISTAALTRRIEEATAFERARAHYQAAGDGSNPRQQSASLAALYQASFGAAMPEVLARHADALARGFALSSADGLGLPADYRAKFTQNIASSAAQFAEYRKRRAMACMDGLPQLQAQLKDLNERYAYPSGIVHTLDPLASGASCARG